MSVETWHATGVRHTEPCGCVYEQRVEPGSDYHEAWLVVVRCAQHAKGAG